MKSLFLLLAAVLLFTACSDQEERSRQAGREIADKMKAPIEEAAAVTDKIKNTRQTGLLE